MSRRAARTLLTVAEGDPGLWRRGDHPLLVDTGCIVEDQPSLDQRRAHGLAVHTHPSTDRSHRDARSGEPHGLRLLVEAQPRAAARHVAATQVGEHRCAVDAVPLSERLDAHPGQVVADEGVYLGGGEESLSRLDSPYNRATIVLRSGILGTSRDLVDPTV